MSAGEQPVLIAAGLTKSFDAGGRVVEVLDAVDLEVHGGVVTGLIGPGAAGKTSLMRLVAGLLLPDGGELRVLDVDPAREPARVQSAVGYMPQRFGLYEDLTVQENLDLYADLREVSPVERPARYRELLEMTGLTLFTRRLAGRLSGGMKQKLGLACTLVQPPRLLLLDEPTVGVDPVTRRELWAIVYRLVQEQGMGVLLSTAYLDDAERCARVVLLHQGRVIGQGTAQDFSRPMQGRVFRVRVPEAERRRAQARLASLPGVVDATLQGEGVRLVCVTDRPPDLAETGLDAAELEPLAPRFEDGFVAQLRGDRPAFITQAPAQDKGNGYDASRSRI